MNTDLDTYRQAIVERDAKAFAKWVAAAEQRLRLALAGFARSVDVEAVIQETLFRVWQVTPRLTADGRPNGMLRLALRIARNVAITEFRRRHPTGPLPEELVAPKPIFLAYESNEALRKAIKDCFDRLPDSPHRAIEARLRGDGRRDEILARTLGMKINTFYQNIRRARVALLNCLKKHGFVLEYDI
jgi:DNA-directed RNA polymerase specialized sigma24 family protein